MNTAEETVTIKRSEYDRLRLDSSFLRKLESMGIDNWEGYEDACENFEYDDER